MMSKLFFIALALTVTLSASQPTVKSDVIADEITPLTRSYCRRDQIVQRSRCACYLAWTNGKWAVDAKSLCMSTYSSDLKDLRRGCEVYMSKGKVSEPMLDKELLKTVRVCGGSMNLIDTMRTSAIRISESKGSKLQPTERLFFIPALVIIIKQAALAALRLSLRALLRLWKVRNALRKAAEQLLKRADKVARKEIRKAIKCMAKEFRNAAVRNKVGNVSEEDLKQSLLKCLRVPDPCIGKVALKLTRGHIRTGDAIMEVAKCF